MAHNRDARVALLYDIKHSTQLPIGPPLPFAPLAGVDAGATPLSPGSVSGMDWIYLPPNLVLDKRAGLLLELRINLEEISVRLIYVCLSCGFNVCAGLTGPDARHARNVLMRRSGSVPLLRRIKVRSCATCVFVSVCLCPHSAHDGVPLRIGSRCQCWRGCLTLSTTSLSRLSAKSARYHAVLVE